MCIGVVCAFVYECYIDVGAEVHNIQHTYTLTRSTNINGVPAHHIQTHRRTHYINMVYLKMQGGMPRAISTSGGTPTMLPQFNSRC